MRDANVRRLVAKLSDAVRELLSVSKISLADIAAVCLDTTCCSVVFMEENGESAIYPCVMWCDMRAGMKETRTF